MKRVVLLAVLAIAAIVIWSCRKDVTITPPPSLSGDYIGTYCIKLPNQEEECQPVTVRFTTDQFMVRADPPDISDQDRKFCDFDGEYELGSNIIMRPRCDQTKYDPKLCARDSNATAETCDLSKDGYGTFVLDQSVEGRLLLQYISGGTEKTFDLSSI